jgi:isopenicillin N synthase-like dioxygenase
MITRVSFEDFRHPERRRLAADAIGEALERDGIFYLHSHNVPDVVIQGAYQAGRRLHDLGSEHKQHVAVGTNGLARGWHQGMRAGKGAYESYEIGTEAAVGSGGDATGILHGPNIWPEIDGFREPVCAYLDAMKWLAQDLTAVIEEAFGLPSGYLHERARLPCCTLRILDYAASETSETQAGIAPHTDFEVFTIISEQAAGLEACNRQGDWEPLAAGTPQELIIMAGDLLEIITNGRVESPLHRVLITPHERQSLAFFFGLDADAEVSPQLEQRPGRESQVYATTQVGEHLAAMQILSYQHLRERHEAGKLLNELSVPSGNPFKEYKLARSTPTQ